MARVSTLTSLSMRRTRLIVNVAIAVLGVLAITSQLPLLERSLTELRDVHLAALAACICLLALTYIAAAITLRLLAVRRLSLPRTVLVQVASGFTNRLLPAGLGGMGVNALYLRRQRHTTAQAVSVVGLNNLLGFVGNGLLVAGAVLLAPSLLRGAHYRLPSVSAPMVAAIVIGALFMIGLVLRSRWLRSRLAAGLQQVRGMLTGYRKRPGRLAAALCSSSVLTALYVSMLWFSAQALDVHLAWLSCLLVMSLGTGLGAVVPTPGGLGGVEAGLVAGMVACGIPAESALAVAIFYRFTVFWLPIVPGAISYYLAVRPYLY